jgi:hypothetical protein
VAEARGRQPLAEQRLGLGREDLLEADEVVAEAVRGGGGEVLEDGGDALRLREREGEGAE